MKRVIIFRNGSQVDGKVILVTHSLEELLRTASQKFGYVAKRVFTSQGGEIDDIKLIRNDDILYVTGDEPFVKVDNGSENYAPSIVLTDPRPCPCGEIAERSPQSNSNCTASSIHSHHQAACCGGGGGGSVGGQSQVQRESQLQSIDEATCKALVPVKQMQECREKKISGKLQNWVKLNVGGKLFTTTRSTLVSKEPTSMLARMFAEDSDYSLTPSDMDETGAYLIDRSPTYFEVILNYLRNGELIYDTNVNPAGILQEARFFGIESLVQHIESVIARSQDILPLSRSNVIKALITTPYKTELRFQGVNLAGSDLSRLDLRNINFKFACLHGCRMVGANLSHCCLERADLSHAVMESAQLIGVRMLCANLEGANLRGCNFDDPSGRYRSNMEGVNLKGANLEGSSMFGVILRVATLKNANLRNCDLREVIFAGADLEKCDLSGSDLYEANLRGANLKDASFELMQTPLHMAQTIS